MAAQTNCHRVVSGGCFLYYLENGIIFLHTQLETGLIIRGIIAMMKNRKIIHDRHYYKIDKQKKMATDFTAKASVAINAGKEEVWDALTNPAKIKQYFFGTNAISDWKRGSSLKFTGEWEGKTYEDKGTILDTVPGKLFRYTYWSSMGKLEDKPENYMVVTYELVPQGDATLLNLTQENAPTAESRDHSEQNWNWILGELKKFVENNKS